MFEQKILFCKLFSSFKIVGAIEGVSWKLDYFFSFIVDDSMQAWLGWVHTTLCDSFELNYLNF